VLVSVPIVLQYAGRATAGKPDRNVLYQYGTAIGGVIAYAIILLFVLLIAGFDRRLLAMRRPRSTTRAIWVSAVLFVGVFVAISLLDRVLHGGREQGLTPTGWQPAHAGAYIANFVVIAVVAPFVEELTFRGLGYSLLEPFGRWTAIGIVGLVFGLSHGLIQGLPELVLFGGALAWLRSDTDSVYPGMGLHSLFNSIALVAAVVS
jgi:membrane protease YdiL (CAAX protease family)